VSLQSLPATALLTRLGDYHDIIDARSEDEFALDRLPGAINWPSLNNEERRIVGTTYKQISAFEARKRGAAMVARNVAAHIEREVLDKPRDWAPLVYCWRGGKRSGSLALILDQIGFKITLIDGGYKAWRAAMVADIPAQVQRLRWQVICGPTGAGKTRLLQRLALAGAQVLDLEALANHRSSVLGLVPGQTQPGQKQFDSRVWDALQGFDAARPVFVESESKKVGNVAVPEALITAMRAAPCHSLEMPDDQRVQLLMEDYDFFVRDAEMFCERLEVLTELRGKAVVAHWKALARSGDMASVVRDLLLTHYDPGYAQSMLRNFTQYPQARPLVAPDRTVASLDSLADRLINEAS
jgi:tRNA 2-selenouridine synthase